MGKYKLGNSERPLRSVMRNPNQQGKQSVSHILTRILKIKILQRKNQGETMDGVLPIITRSRRSQ